MKKKVVVFGGRACIEEKKEYYFNLAYQTGKALAEAGFIVVTGAGPGLMDETLRGAVEANGETIGMCLNIEGRVQSVHALEKVLFDNLVDRQTEMRKMADAFIALPGGIGTLYEITEILALKSMTEISQEVPLILLDDYYSSLKNLFNEMIAEGFTQDSLHNSFQYAKSPEEAVLFLKHLNLEIKKGTDKPSLINS